VLLCTIVVSAVIFVAWRLNAEPVVGPLAGSLPATVVVFQDGRPGQTVTLSANSAALRYVDRLVHERSRRWRRSILTFASEIMIRSDSCTVNVQKTAIILNCKDGTGTWRQYFSRSDPATFDIARKAVLADFPGVSREQED
jgi:hypothetical protein